MDMSERIEVLKAGKPVGEHECEDFWVDKINLRPPVDVIDYMRICSKCGRTEHVSETRETENFDSVFEKFHGTEAI